jgi:hypothetical protein
MLITYFDEVKYDAADQRYQWIGGITVEDRLVKELEDQVRTLAEECFGDGTLSRATEFHAVDIFHRKRNFKSWPDIPRRLNVLKRLAKIIDRPDEVLKVYVRLEPARMVATDDFDLRAFMFFVEKVDSLVSASGMVETPRL